MKFKMTTGQKLLIAVLLLIIVVAIFLGLYAWAKYTSSITGQTSMQVAKWHFDLTNLEGESLSETGVIDLAETLSFEHVASDRIAPGTSGQFQMVVDTTGTEVDLVYTVDVALTNCPVNLNFYTSNTYTEANKISKVGDNLHFEEYVSKDDAATFTKTISIYWNWPYETLDNNNSAVAGDIQDNLDNGKIVTMNITAKGTEVLEEPVSESVDKAENILVLNNNESPYVNYTDANGNTILCRVLYNDSAHGVQLISQNSLDNVVLGKSDVNYTTGTDLEKSQNSYNNAIENLNIKAKSYMNNSLSDDARCVGSVATLNNGRFLTKNDAGFEELLTNPNNYSYLQTYVDQGYKGEDTHYEEDYNKLGTLGLRSGLYWMASRYVYTYSTSAGFFVRFEYNDNVYFDTLFDTTGDAKAPSFGFRPVFLLKANVKVTGGEGTSESPYEIAAY